MTLIKALLPVLAGVSISTADISGIVMDTGSIPLPLAVVQLEKGGQKVTTGPDGNFTLTVPTSVLLRTGTLLQNGFSPRVINGRLNVTIAQKSVVEITMFNLGGKVLSIIRQTMDAGNHSIMLSQWGTGVCLYKVKAGNVECVLKGNTTFGIAAGSSISSSNRQVKQAKNRATFNDVIFVTNTGYLDYRVVAYNPDTTGVEITMVKSAGTMTDADGNEYQTVKIGKQVWMAENLRTTKYNDGTEIPLVTDSTAWHPEYDSFLTTPAYCFYRNTIDADSIKKFGALYNWYVVDSTNPKKIAPTGWHVPKNEEWDTLRNYLINNGYNWPGETTDDWTAKALAAKTDWKAHTSSGTIGSDLPKNNSSGFSALPGGCRNHKAIFGDLGTYGYWWSATQEEDLSIGRIGSYYELHYAGHRLDWGDPSGRDLSKALSIRLLKN